MKRLTEVRYPHSANLFQFCKKILDQKFGGIRIIDQDVGQILGFDPADCSHWKKGKKNVRSIQSMRAIAEHLGVDEQLVVDVASGDVDADEGYFEFSGYGDFELSSKFFEIARKDLLKKSASYWSKEKDLELKAFCDKALADVESKVQEIHGKINFSEAPLYLPELASFYTEIKYRSIEAREGGAPLTTTETPDGLDIAVEKTRESRPFIRFQIAKALGKHFLSELITQTSRDYQDFAPKLNDIFCNIFAARLLAPATLIRKEMGNIQLGKNIVNQLSEVFWVSRTLMNRRIKEVLQS